MATQLWLPIRSMLRPVQSERDELLNRLIEIRVIIPGAQEMEIQELRDLVQWQEERTAADAKKALWRPANRPKKHSRADVHAALLEYFYDYVKPHREGRRKNYGGVSLPIAEG